ncbi:MAG: ribonuclease P protein component [Planctomycetes bacterium]|nr:ribonuclease P protein component [Planctomycetota bacterium]
MTPDTRLRPRERLRKEGDFARVYAARNVAADVRLMVFVRANGLAWSRLGLSTSRRIGGAVVRNYARRRLREAFRTFKDALPRGWDIVCVVKRRLERGDAPVGPVLRALVERAVRAAARKQGIPP